MLSASLLEAVLPMPAQEAGMRTLERSLRGDGSSAPIDEGAHASGIVSVPGDQHVEMVRQIDQPRSNRARGSPGVSASCITSATVHTFTTRSDHRRSE